MLSSQEPASRSALRTAQRVTVKAGTAVVANENGSPSLTRLGAIVEQIAELKDRGIEVIFVSSGAVGMGKRVLKNQRKLKMSFMDMQEKGTDFQGPSHFEGASHFEDQPSLLLSVSKPMGRNSSFATLLDNNTRPHTLAEKKNFYDSACAAAGQLEMVNLYSALFNQCNIAASQVLVTQADFADPYRLQNLKYTVERLLKLGILPIINENDAVSGNMGYTTEDHFSDNDSLAATCARNFDAEVLLLLTDVNGVYDQPPSNPGAKLIGVYVEDKTEVEIGAVGSQGRGGMESN